ncbi:recombination regulator RecX [Stenotrophomonas mori]|uniref:Regulatory protein RecX n=1 Tax=Stenotrophomonas mori TaxID=2871096 RepID=A0ABT0SEU1_9GAMM|nr:recombination regulator RecX [Stenotrophomonas mori]MCL7713569.1 recombination regulator RecX [Stenotrophomonas mori]
MDTGSDERPAARGRKRTREQTPLQRALGFLVRREHSRRELMRKLQARGVEKDEAVAALDRLAEEGWQDDGRFAASLVRTRSAAGYGPLHLRAELGMHGLDEDAITTAMATFEGDWTELARQVVCRRYGPEGPQELAQRRKAADMLIRRGFEAGCIRDATRYDPED